MAGLWPISTAGQDECPVMNMFMDIKGHGAITWCLLGHRIFTVVINVISFPHTRATESLLLPDVPSLFRPPEGDLSFIISGRKKPCDISHFSFLNVCSSSILLLHTEIYSDLSAKPNVNYSSLPSRDKIDCQAVTTLTLHKACLFCCGKRPPQLSKIDNFGGEPTSSRLIS